jgi:hypothetical protein
MMVSAFEISFGIGCRPAILFSQYIGVLFYQEFLIVHIRLPNYRSRRLGLTTRNDAPRTQLARHTFPIKPAVYDKTQQTKAGQ